MNFVSSSLPVVAQLATRIAVMGAGQFVEVGAAEQILHRPAHPYTCSFFSVASLSTVHRA